MSKTEVSCAHCRLRACYDRNPKSLPGRFWHWHIRFCPGWKAFLNSLDPSSRDALRKKYG